MYGERESVCVRVWASPRRRRQQQRRSSALPPLLRLAAEYRVPHAADSARTPAIVVPIEQGIILPFQLRAARNSSHMYCTHTHTLMLTSSRQGGLTILPPFITLPRSFTGQSMQVSCLPRCSMRGRQHPRQPGYLAKWDYSAVFNTSCTAYSRILYCAATRDAKARLACRTSSPPLEF